MAGYIIVDVQTRKIILICAAVTIVFFVIGILIGFFSGKGSKTVVTSSQSVADALRTSCSDIAIKTPSGKLYFDRYVERHGEKQACVTKPEDCWDFGLPRHYNAYHLNGKSIVVDGKLDDDAWKEVPWSEEFVDMRSNVYPKPYLDTKFKMRWDDGKLYIGAYIEETNLWATYTTPESPIYKENGFEFLMDVDGSMFNYKQVQINVLGTMLDQVFYKSPWDAPDIQTRNKTWEPDAEKSVYTEGTVNNPGDEDKYWSFELALTFEKLAENSQRVQPRPIDNEVWFIEFARSEQQLNATGGTYQKVKGSKTDWWAWQPCDTINLHLQDRWGLVQFKKDREDKKFKFDKWHIYKALFDSMDAMKKYKAIQGRYTTAIEELDMPPYLLARTCVDIPEIQLVKRANETILNQTTGSVDDFDVTIKSMFISHAPAHIRSDRYVTFDQR